ncbi:MAG: dienelactone hydrolase family protein [Tepidisphaeraceae bacterium]
MNPKKINITTLDGIADCYIFHPPDKGKCPGVIIYPDAFGIRPALLEMAERLSSNGYDVLLPNLFYRAGPYPPFDPQAVFKDETERDRLMALMRSINHGLVMRDTSAFLDYLAGQSPAGSKVGCVGYCMGGGFALTAAATFPDRVAAAASFHGGNLATDRPDSPHLLAGKIRARVYIGVAGIDPHFPESEKERLQAALQAAGVRYHLEVYPAARHGFTMTDLPVYDREACERHWQCLLQLFREAGLYGS